MLTEMLPQVPLGMWDGGDGCSMISVPILRVHFFELERIDDGIVRGAAVALMGGTFDP